MILISLSQLIKLKKLVELCSSLTCASFFFVCNFVINILVISIGVTVRERPPNSVGTLVDVGLSKVWYLLNSSLRLILSCQ